MMMKKQFVIRTVACAVSLWAGSAFAALQAPTAVELMDWAQAQLAEFFPGKLPDQTGTGFVFRGPYATGHFMGVADGTVYVLGPATGGQLLSVGTLESLACTVKPAACGPSNALELAKAFFAKVDTVYAAEITSASIAPLMDGCYLQSGRTRAYEMAQLQDASARSHANARRGSTRSNLQVTGESFTINPDGSQRREIVVTYDIAYADGTVVPERDTLIQGSSAGTLTAAGTACATPQVSQDVRVLGNRRIVGTSVTSMNMVLDRFKLSDGTPVNTAPRLYRSEIRFNVSDPAGVATYATISGPGIVFEAYKMVSPRLLRDAPEFAGKYGNFVDWKDTDPFKLCRIAYDNNNYQDAALADCTTFGAGNNYWRSNATTAAESDRQFATFGFEAGGVYTIKVYGDDGWKTVNGQQGKTPLATYTTTLNRLPASAAAMEAGGSSAFGMAMIEREIQADGGIGIVTSVTARQTQQAKIDGVALPFTSLYFYRQGRTSASTANNFYPGSRMSVSMDAAPGATEVTVPVPLKPAAMSSVNYSESGVAWGDRRGYSMSYIMTRE